MKYAWIDQHRRSFPTAIACRVLHVSTAGFHGWRRQPTTAGSSRQRRREQLDAAVAASHAKSHGIYGSRKVAAELRRSSGGACRNTVARSMRRQNLHSRVVRRRRPRTTQSDPSAKPAANLLDRQFVASAPDRKWVCDVTYVGTDRGWVYLATMIDLFSRRVVGWSMADHLRTELVSAALRDAVEQRRVGPGLLHHSDRGCQYTSADYRRVLATLSIEQSMSGVGDCYDNAVAESFFGSFKTEWANHQRYPDLAAARRSVMRYIHFYNHHRLHQTLGYQTPDEYEQHHQHDHQQAVHAPAKLQGVT